MSDLPYITKDLPGTGGKLKERDEDFIVEEIPLYGPSGEGQHVYVRLARKGMTTRDVENRLKDLFGLKNRAIGYAGKKDKHAWTTQTFSLDMPKAELDEVRQTLEGEEDFELVWVERHRNKIKRGHLVGNLFTVAITDTDPEAGEALERAREVAEAIEARGVANFYGEQRFGKYGDNAEQGLEIIRGERREGRRWLRNLLKNSYQSELFNQWLSARIDRGWFSEIFEGDVAKKTDTGGLFDVEDIEQERPRFQDREIVYTGPMYGDELWWASGTPGELEKEVFEAAEVTMEELAAANLRGSRRRALLYLEELEVSEHPRGVQVKFSLPKGAYATVVMREFMKNDED